MPNFQSDRTEARRRAPRVNVSVVGNIPPDADMGVCVPGSPEERGFTGYDLPPSVFGVAEGMSPKASPDCRIPDPHAGE